MTEPLRWRAFAKGDSQALKSFVCTDPVATVWDGKKRLPHPRPWELEVQSWIRTYKPKPRAGDRQILGWDSEGRLSAVVAWSLDERRTDLVWLQVLAVSMRFRRCGGFCAREALAQALLTMEAEAKASGSVQLFVTAKIHIKNGPSKALCSTLGLVRGKDKTGDYETWHYLADIVP